MQSSRFLIVRTDRIGDVILSSPLPKAIKKKYPDSFVAVLLREYTKDIYRNNPYVDEIIVTDKYPFFGLLKKLRKNFFTHSLVLMPTEKINWLLFLSGIKKRIGVGYKFYQFLTNTKSVFRNKYKPLRHESDYCLDEIRKLGFNIDDVKEEIYLTDEETEKSIKFKKSICKKDEFLVGVNTSSGNSAPNLSTFEYVKLIRELIKIKNLKIIITENNPSKDIIDIEDVLFLSDGKGLRDDIIKFSSLDLLISSSTGPMHIAAGLDVKTLSLFCPLPACSPELWAPKGNESFILLPEDSYCKNKCPGNPKLCDFSGDGGINTAKIINKVKLILKLE